ncbi:hypothetical protein Nepgr_003170 [Nepenthes gracilis]|uniref:Uncharacterized protein n=1 Tax=Nepenthes gracilis TaxID=150966 RepID=A0AAD3RZ02_NEPGR|nr:hypothetical protein Nepgr_003170 [Nepenthes gracilis]
MINDLRQSLQLNKSLAYVLTRARSASSLNEPPDISTAFDGDQVDTEMVALESGGCLREVEEELQRKIENEAVAKKLEETLECQRRIEDEAKKKHLADQCSRNAQAALDDVADGWVDFSLHPGGLVECRPANNLDDMQRNTIGVDTVQLPNGGVPNGSVLPSDQWTGRKGKRRSAAKIQEGRYHAMPFFILISWHVQLSLRQLAFQFVLVICVWYSDHARGELNFYDAREEEGVQILQ